MLLRSWAPIEQAKGIVSVLFAVAPEEAFLLLQVAALQRQETVRRTARQVVSTAVDQPPGGAFGQVHEHVTKLLFSGLDQTSPGRVPDNFLPDGMDPSMPTLRPRPWRQANGKDSGPSTAPLDDRTTDEAPDTAPRTPAHPSAPDSGAVLPG